MKHLYKKPQRYLFLSLLFLLACSEQTKIIKVETSRVDFSTKENINDSVTSELVAPYKKQMDAIMNEVLGYSDTSMVKDNPEGVLGNFVADATLQMANDKYSSRDSKKIDFSLYNNGGLRSSLPKGKITLGNVYELMPFDNALVVLTISGEKAKKLFDYLVEYNGAPFSGARIIAKSKKITSIKIGNENFDVNKNYKVLTSDYLAAGGDKYIFFRDAIKIDTLNYLLRDAIADYIKQENKKGKNITSKKDGRIILE
jgi:2',3'-cyclic-nucleotide 2'-phosphodiesterase (5'-nucleotidase family)